MATGRNRSGTLLSQLSSQVQAHSYPSQSVVLAVSIHGNQSSNYPNVVLNRERWPGIQVGDVIELRASHMKEPCVFIIDQNDPVGLPQHLQVSLSSDIAKCFDLKSGAEVTLTKAKLETHAADAVEVCFSDQYLGRCDMWRLSSLLVGKCWHTLQRVQFVGCISATIKHIYAGKKEVKAAYITPDTKIVYRSLTAKCTIFIQICRELLDFAEDGERFYEKVVHSFLPALFKRWRELKTGHVITIVLISRVFYDASEVDYAAGPIQRDDEGRNYKDFFKVITDIEVIDDWNPTLNVMKEALVTFQRDILLTHHYHHHQDTNDQAPKLVGRISYAHDGPILEALNLSLNPTESHYIDRSLSLTGASTILITPGRGHFRVNKKLLKLTTTRLLDQGFGLDVVALGKAPLHATPLFSFLAADPSRYGRDSTPEDRADDPLWGGPPDDVPIDGRKVIYWQPFWIYLMFWDIQMDLPFRADQYVPRARMPRFEMMGLLHYDLISSIAIPALETRGAFLDTAEGQDHFDQDVFSSGPASVGSLASPEESLVHKNSVAKSSVAASLGVPIVKPSPLRRTPSNTSLASVPRQSKLPRTDSIEEGERPSRRTRPISGQVDDVMRERLSAILPGTSPKTTRIGQLQAQAERRQRTSSHSMTMTEASSSTLVGRPSTGRAKSPSQSRRNSVAQPPRMRKNSTSSISQTTAVEDDPAPPGITCPPAPRKTAATTTESVEKRQSGLIPFAKFPTGWLFTPWKLNATAAKPNLPASIQAAPSTTKEADSLKKLAADVPAKHVTTTQPLAITDRRSGRKNDEANPAPGQPLSVTQTSPMSTSPAETPNLGTSFRNSTGSGLVAQQFINPSAAEVPVLQTQTALARRWEHIYTLPTAEGQIKWKSMESPGCLPLTTGYFPTKEELEKAYRMHRYEVSIGTEMSESFLVKRPTYDGPGPIPEVKWALSIMRVMVALRLAQGFQFVLLSDEQARQLGDFGFQAPPRGPSEVLIDIEAPVYLSMSDQVHRLQYDPLGPSIRVERFVRRSVSSPPPIPYRCLIWPKRGGGYTECNTQFKSPEMELYGWNRADMLAFGYEQQFSESLRYWRTRFIIIPTEETPEPRTSKGGGKALSDEETRLIGMEKLAEHFTKARWLKHGETLDSYAPVKFLPTTLDSIACVNDEVLMTKLDEIHESGSLKKKANTTRKIETTASDLMALAGLMRQAGGVHIRDNQWHTVLHRDSFTGEEFVSWLLREFNDVSTREQGAEWGARLERRGFLAHCRGYHGFLDGHYYYRLLAPYQAGSNTRPAPPYKFASRILRGVDERSNSTPSAGGSSVSPARNNNSPREQSTTSKRRILSQSMVIDVDPHKKSSNSETAILHHDIIQNPDAAFHFQLHWVGTSAKFIDDMIQTWSRVVDRYGLRLVEAYVDQIVDITRTNVFQSCFPIQFSVPPPMLPPNSGMQPDYFEGCLLRYFNYIPDICSSFHYTNQADVYYSYRNTPFTYSQYVHKSGLAFVQIIEGKGFSWLTNRLATIRQITVHEKPLREIAERPNKIMDDLNEFCMNKEKLGEFWDKVLQELSAKSEGYAQVPVQAT